MIRIIDEGIAYTGQSTGRTSHCGFPGIVALANGSLLMVWRVGSDKDSADGTILQSRSNDQGRTWSAPQEPFSTIWDGRPGDLHACKYTHLGGDELLACFMWIDRSDSELPMFHPETEGILPIKVLFSLSSDAGRTWGLPWALDDAPYGEVLAMTGPVIVLPDGRWVCQIEVNKPYLEPSPWRHQAAIKFSSDRGQTWSAPIVVAADPSGRVRYWDQRHAVGPQGTWIAAYWTFDAVESRDRNITIGETVDRGVSWSAPRDTGLTGQVPYPIFLPDGRLVLLSVDRFTTRTIRARLGDARGLRFEDRDFVIYRHDSATADLGNAALSNADHLQQQQRWTFGFVSGICTSDGDVWLTYYNTSGALPKIHWARLRVS